MYKSVYDLKAFYNGKMGHVVQRILQDRLRALWPDVRGLRVMGCGYTTPYLGLFKGEAERVFALMPAGREWESCVHPWPQEGGNCAALAEPYALPIETNSVDRILMVHDAEFSEFLKPALQEIWRVLKSNGRLMVVVPNRSGLWARFDSSPFGQGRPFSAYQIEYALREALFVHERTEGALFMPPLKHPLCLKSADFFEKMGKAMLPIVAGVHIVEVSKQIYAPLSERGVRFAVPVQAQGGMVPKPAMQGHPFHHKQRKQPS